MSEDPVGESPVSESESPVTDGSAREHTGEASAAGPRLKGDDLARCTSRSLHVQALLTPERMHELAPALLDAAAELGPISNASTLFGRPALGKG